MPPGSLPSTTALASVSASENDPANAFAWVPGRFSMSRMDDRRSPYLGLNPPATNSKFSIVSGLNALVRPNSRYGS